MYNNFKNTILKFIHFNEQELEQFVLELTPVRIKKKEFFLKEGQTNRHQAFINEGVFRYFYLKDGNEYTRKYFFEGSWVGDYSSFLKLQPSPVYIEALTDAELFLLSYEKMQKLYEISQKFERFGRLIAEYSYMELATISASLLMDSPEERYVKLTKDHPDLFEKVPLYHVASYLGIKPESLSRIRKRMS